MQAYSKQRRQSRNTYVDVLSVKHRNKGLDGNKYK